LMQNRLSGHCTKLCRSAYYWGEYGLRSNIHFSAEKAISLPPRSAHLKDDSHRQIVHVLSPSMKEIHTSRPALARKGIPIYLLSLVREKSLIHMLSRSSKQTHQHIISRSQNDTHSLVSSLVKGDYRRHTVSCSKVHSRPPPMSLMKGHSHSPVLSDLKDNSHSPPIVFSKGDCDPTTVSCS
jgi:hypothetical protein